MELARTPSFRLEGRRALVTGGGRGIGLAAASALAEAGANVTLAARSKGEIEAAASAIRARGQAADALPLDVTDLHAVRDAIGEAEPFDILVNNAGANRPAMLVEVTVEDWRTIQIVNAESVFFLCQQVGARLNPGGAIVNLSSSSAKLATSVDVAPYAASKTTILSITRSFAYTLVIALGTPLGALCGALCADSLGRRRTIIGASGLTILLGIAYATFTSATNPWLILTVGFSLIVAIYIQVAVLFGVYTPELFPTDVRLRANGLCHTFGRAATIVSPFIVLWLSQTYGISGVLALMVAFLTIQIIAVWAWGVEPSQRPLEELDSVEAIKIGATS